MRADEPVVVGLVGYGYWGPNILRNYMELPTLGSSGFATRIQASLPRRRSGIQPCSHRRLLRHLAGSRGRSRPGRDTDFTHFGLALAAVEAGKHVFVEKPMTASVLEHVHWSRRRVKGVTLMVGHTFEYSSPVVAIKRMIASGELGESTTSPRAASTSACTRRT